jgi:D-tyrosyl-tRNA(Tyr) deacylase
MRIVLQRVTGASVTVDGQITGSIGKGIVVLLGVGVDDEAGDASYLATKISNLRIFEDEEGKFNRSLLEIGGEVLVVSQFTLYGDCRRGRRPSFSLAAPPEKARRLYELFVTLLREKGLKVATGIFQAHMLIDLVNDGPVTFCLDSK